MNRLLKIALAVCLLLAPAGAQDDLPDPDKQQKVYVPIGDLARVVDPDRKSILLQRDAFQRLLRRARRNRVAASKPLAEIVTGRFQARLEGDRVLLKGTLGIRCLSDSPVAVDLPFGSLGLHEARLDDAPAPMNYDEHGRLRLIVAGVGTHELTVTGVAALAEVPDGGMRLAVEVPPAVAGQWQLLLPGDQEALANVPVHASRYDPGTDRTEVVLTTGGVSKLVVLLLGNGRQDDDRAILLGDATTLVHLAPEGAHLDCYFRLQVLRRPVRELTFLIDSGWTILNISSPDLVRWDVTEAGNAGPSRIDVQMRSPLRGSQLLHVEAVAPLGDSRFQAPRIRLDAADYQRGYLLVETDDHLAVRSESLTRARRQDTSRLRGLPALLGPADRVYHHWSADWDLQLDLARITMRRHIEMRQRVGVRPESLQIDAEFEVTPVGREMYDLSIALPPAESGWDLSHVSCTPAKDGYQYRLVESPQGRQLRIELAAPVKAEALLRVGVRLHRPMPVSFDADSSGADGESLTTQIPVLTAEADKLSGLVAIWVVDDLDAAVSTSVNALQPVAIGRLASLGFDRNVRTAYRFAGEVDGQVQLQIRTRRPRITAQTVGLVMLQPTGMGGRFNLAYEIDRASTRTLWLLVPRQLGSNVQFRVLGRVVPGKIVQPGKESIPLTEDQRQYWNLWKLNLHRRVRGTVPVQATYQTPMDGGQIAIPLIRPAGVERASEIVAVQASEQLALDLTATAAREIDLLELPDSLRAARRILGAWRIHPIGQGRARIVAKVTEYDRYSVPVAVVTRMSLLTLLDPAGRQNTRVKMTIANAGLQFLTAALPDAAELWSARVNGQVVKPSRNAEGRLQLPLPKSAEGIEVVLVYAAQGEQGLAALELIAPDLPGLEINEVRWDVVPPDDYVVTGQHSRMSSDGLYRPVPAAELVGRIFFSPMLPFGRGVGGQVDSSAAADEDEELQLPVTQTETPQQDDSGAFEGRHKVAGRYTLPVDMVQGDYGGRVYTFTGLGRPRLQLTLRSRRSMWNWMFAAAAVGLLGTALLVRTTRRRRWGVLLAVAVLCLLLGMVWAAVTPVLNGLLLGVLLGSILLGLLRLVGWAIGHVRAAWLPAAAGLLIAAVCPDAIGQHPPGAADAEGNSARRPWIVPYSGDPTQAPGADRVLLGYDRFVRLWNLAHPDERIEVADPATQLSISEARYEVRIDRERIDLTLRARVVSGGSEWSTLPMDFGRLAVTSTALGDSPARIRRGPGRRDRLMIPPETDAVLTVQAVGALAEKTLRGKIQLDLPALPAAVMHVALARDGLRLEADGLDAPVIENQGGWLVPIGPAGRVQLRWAPGPGTGAEDRTLSAEAHHSVYSYPWAHVGRTRMTYRFQGLGQERFELLVPAETQITWAGGANLRDHRVVGRRQIDGQAFDVLDVRLHRPATGSHELDLRWICPLGPLDQAQRLRLPRAGGVGREAGRLDLYAAPGVRLKVAEITGARRKQIPASQTEPVAGAELVASYYWPYRPMSVRVQPSRLEARPRLRLDQLVRINDRQVQLLSRVQLQAEQGRLYGSSFSLPDGYELLSVRGEAVGDWFVQDTDSGRQLHVNFMGGEQATELAVVCVRRQVDPDALAVPMLTALDADGKAIAGQSGRLAVQVAPALEAQTVAAPRLKPVAPQDLSDWLGSGQIQAVQFSYRYDGPDAVLALRIEPRPTRISAEVINGVSVRPDSAWYTYRIRYQIQGSPIDRVRFTLPRHLAPLVDVQSNSLRSVEVRPLDDQRAQWTVYLLNEVTGPLDVGVNFSIPLGRETSSLPLPALWTEQADDGYRAVLAIQNLSRHEIRLQQQQGLSAVPTAEQRKLLPAGVEKDLQYVLQSFDSDYRARLAVRPAEATERIAATIDLMQVTTAIDRAGQCRYEIVLLLQNRSEQFLQLQLPDELKLWSAMVDGQAVRPVVGSGGSDSVRVPLVRTSAAGLPYEVKLYLGGSLGGGIDSLQRIQPPAVRVANIPVKRTTWSLLLPEEYRYIRPEGNMSPVAGTAELMSLNVDAKIEQLSRVIASTDKQVLSRGDFQSKFRSTNKQLAEEIQGNERYIRDNWELLDEGEQTRLQKKISSQYQAQQALEARLREATEQANIQTFDVNGLLNASNVNAGLAEDERNRSLQVMPGFLRHAEKEMESNLQGQLAENRAQFEQIVDTSAARPGPQAAMLDGGLGGLLAGDGHGGRSSRPGRQIAGAKGLEDRVYTNLRREQAELGKRLSKISESRLQRYYGRDGKITLRDQTGGQGQAGQQGQPGRGRQPDPTPSEQPDPAPALESDRLALPPDEIAFEESQSTTTGSGPMAPGGGFDAAVASGTFSLPVAMPESGFTRLDFAYPGDQAEISVLAVPDRAVREGVDAAAVLAGLVVVALGAWLLRGLILRRRRQKVA